MSNTKVFMKTKNDVKK